MPKSDTSQSPPFKCMQWRWKMSQNLIYFSRPEFGVYNMCIYFCCNSNIILTFISKFANIVGVVKQTHSNRHLQCALVFKVVYWSAASMDNQTHFRLVFFYSVKFFYEIISDEAFTFIFCCYWLLLQMIQTSFEKIVRRRETGPNRQCLLSLHFLLLFKLI